MAGGGAIAQERISVPGDKSLSHRALIFAALADGSSHIRGILESADIAATAQALRALGCVVPQLAGSMTIEGRGLRMLRASAGEGHAECDNSGTTARLLSGVAAAAPRITRFTGDASLSRRPMRRVTDPLIAMGAVIEWQGEEGRLPMIVRGGPLNAVDWESPNASAQVKGAILLAGLCAGVPARVREPLMSRDHTERFLVALGASVAHDDDGWIRAPVVETLPSFTADIPGDPSSAAFLVARAALSDEGTLTIRRVLLNPQRTGFIDVMRRMGVRVSFEDVSERSGEPVGDIFVQAGIEPAGTTIEAHEIPGLVDEIPAIVALASQIEGETIVRGAGELRVKESDRIAALVTNLRAIGADADERDDGLIVRGSRRPLSGRVVTHGDHRIAMAFGVLGSLPGNHIVIDNRDCVAVSYPPFWGDVGRLFG